MYLTWTVYFCRLFKFPSKTTRSGAFERWFRSIHRKSVDDDISQLQPPTVNDCVCSAHFIDGAPSEACPDPVLFENCLDRPVTIRDQVESVIDDLTSEIAKHVQLQLVNNVPIAVLNHAELVQLGSGAPIQLGDPVFVSGLASNAASSSSSSSSSQTAPAAAAAVSKQSPVVSQVTKSAKECQKTATVLHSSAGQVSASLSEANPAAVSHILTRSSSASRRTIRKTDPTVNTLIARTRVSSTSALTGGSTAPLCKRGSHVRGRSGACNIGSTGRSCFVVSCFNSDYRLQRWRSERCSIHGAFRGDPPCDCPPPFR